LNINKIYVKNSQELAVSMQFRSTNYRFWTRWIQLRLERNDRR